jgi:hypothetical protein
MTQLRGSCLCGAVAYEVDLPFARFVTCWCSRCRKASGTSPATNAYVMSDAFRWTRGTDRMARYDLPTARSFATSFCRTCGTPLPHPTRSGREIVIPAGSLDDDPGVVPTERSFPENRAAWARVDG